MSPFSRKSFPIKLILKPFEWLYSSIVSFRNSQYDSNPTKVTWPTIPTISVGNITVGGTGKTPMIEALVREYSTSHKIAILSRGYGRKTKGVILANPSSTAEEIGDEPLQFYQKFNGEIPVVVAEKRTKGLEAIYKHYPEVTLLLLDDAYQHRAIGRHVNILLTDYNRPFYTDSPFPTGDLRESRLGANRADIILVTKCPSTVSELEKKRINESLAPYIKNNAPVYFSSVSYSTAVPFDMNTNQDIQNFSEVKVISGIAKNEPFIEYTKQHYKVNDVFLFKDHHMYTLKDFPHLSPSDALLTTEKDSVKLFPLALELNQLSQCFYIPISTDIQNKEHFRKTVDTLLHQKGV